MAPSNDNVGSSGGKRKSDYHNNKIVFFEELDRLDTLYSDDEGTYRENDRSGTSGPALSSRPTEVVNRTPTGLRAAAEYGSSNSFKGDPVQNPFHTRPGSLEGDGTCSKEGTLSLLTPKADSRMAGMRSINATTASDPKSVETVKHPYGSKRKRMTSASKAVSEEQQIFKGLLFCSYFEVAFI